MARVLISKTSITGEVKAYAGTSAPEGYLFCQGQAVSRATYSDLFSVLGTSHGQGDGVTTFSLPDYRGTFLRGRVNVTTITASGAVSSNNATFTNHGINRTGFKVRLQSAGGLTGLALSTDYYAIVIDNNTLAFATTLANAITGTKIVISGVGPLTTVIVQYEDPDYASRAAVTVGGNSAGGLGSVQDDELKSHIHSLLNNTVTAGTTNVSSGGAATSNTMNTNATGGSETRPKNSLINYIIKY